MVRNPVLKTYCIRALLFALPIVWMLTVGIPETLKDRIFPFDSALIAANGALFERLFSEFDTFFRMPLDWLWSYYDQYPALSVRRHPPLFGIVAGIVYSFIGVSTISAKITVMLFGLLFACGVFVVARRLFSDWLLASAATLLIVATPQIGIHFESVWLDIPSLAFAIWAIHFYLLRQDGNKTLGNVIWMVVFSVLALYTYQPTIVLLCGLFLHVLFSELSTIYKDREILVGAGILIVLMLPLAVFTLLIAPDNLQITTGEIPDQWQEFSSPTYASWLVTDKLSLAYWTQYLQMISASYPVQLFGICLWVVLLAFRRPSSGEVMFMICLVVTYFGFSWLLVKGHRYTLYMMIPASYLTIAALRDSIELIARDSRKVVFYAGSIGLFLAVLQGVFVSAYAPYTKISGMSEPVSFILAKNKRAKIFYSGRCDAAFVFYTRSLDPGGFASVRRASVQLTIPNDLREYVESENVDFVVVELENKGYDSLEITDDFRNATMAYLRDTESFMFLAEYHLPYGAYDNEGSVLLHVYGRQVINPLRVPSEIP